MRVYNNASLNRDGPSVDARGETRHPSRTYLWHLARVVTESQFRPHAYTFTRELIWLVTRNSRIKRRKFNEIKENASTTCQIFVIKQLYQKAWKFDENVRTLFAVRIVSLTSDWNITATIIEPNDWLQAGMILEQIRRSTQNRTLR